MKALVIKKNQKYNFLLTIKETTLSKYGKKRWLCRCVCGKLVKKCSCDLISGHVTSCGCQKIKSGINSPFFKHGAIKTKMYQSWLAMRARCANKKIRAYRWYGAKGIKVCSDWDSFINFRNWSLRNGYKLGLSIDRINPKLGYFPENCQWITRLENVKRMLKYYKK